MTTPTPIAPAAERLGPLLAQVKRLAREYRALTGRPLGVTGEVAEYEAARLLGLALAEVREPGYDAVRCENGRAVRLQIKARCLDEGGLRAGRMGRIDKTKPWDAVLLVLLDSHLDVTAIYEADRAAVMAALEQPGSVARNTRGALAVGHFIRIARRVWPESTPP